MTKKDLRINLIDLGIHSERYLDKAIAEEFDEDEIYTKDGHSYLIYDSELTSDEINTALLAKQVKDLQLIKKMTILIVGIALSSLVFSVISIMFAMF